MKTNYYLKKKMLDTLAFIFFLIGSYIIYWKLGRWVAIGVALEVLSVYLFVYIGFKMNVNESMNETEDDEDKDIETNN